MGKVELTIMDKLQATTAITSVVPATNIQAHELRLSSASKQIVVKDSLGASEPILQAESGLITILVYIKDSVDQPYKTCYNLLRLIQSTLDRLNESLTDSNSFVRKFLKQSGEVVYNSETQEYMGQIVFSYVVGE